MPKPVNGRPPVKTNQLVAQLRQRIVAGEWQPRQRLPTRRELCLVHGVSSVTTQQALARLVAEGFVVPRGTHGTFVAAEPPHLGHYAVVFPESAERVGENRFWLALQHEARHFSQDLGVRLKCYYGLTAAETWADDGASLLADVQARRLAGLIFATSPWRFAGTPILAATGLARVAVMAPSPRYPQVAAISLGETLVDRALDYLAAEGRKRVAILHPPRTPEIWGTPLLPALSQRGLSTRPYWRLILPPSAPEGARPCMHLLFHSGQPERPDGLIIADDNLVTMASAGLLDAGVHLPEDLTVVAHANFPWPTASLVPVRYLGYDAREVLRRCLAACDQQVRGQGVPPPLWMPARFADELPEDVRQASAAAPARQLALV